MTSLTRPTVVFVHGILSSGAIFKPLHDACKATGAFTDLRAFEYDYNRGLADNGRQLALVLNTVDSDVILICHSMGGLVGRLAVLGGTVPQVRRLIMLATPNFGAMRTATAGLLAQLTLRTVGHVAAIFRRPGILELTRAPQIMRNAIANGERAARDVEYVTSPGRYFHKYRDALEWGDLTTGSLSTKAFIGTTVGLEALLGLFPLWSPVIEKPHDGVVEETSTSLVPAGAGRRTEKNASITDAARWGYTYAHVSTPRCDELNHVMIHSDPEIVRLVVDCATAESLQAWVDGLTPEQRLDISIEPPPPAAAPLVP
jgi:pimeloyl-ACP methyl ester carboxylesterase